MLVYTARTFPIRKVLTELMPVRVCVCVMCLCTHRHTLTQPRTHQQIAADDMSIHMLQITPPANPGPDGDGSNRELWVFYARVGFIL